MPVARPDPAPRTYPASVSLHRRADGGPAVAAGTASIEDVESWLLTDALGEEDVLPFFEQLCWRLVAAGLPLDRASLHVGTLHPQLYGFGWNWNRVDGLCDEVRVAEAALANDAYRRNPLFHVIEKGEPFRGRTGDAAERYPLMAELALQGYVDYAAIPLRAGGAYHNAATVATKRAGGFSEAEFGDLMRLLRLAALHVERHIALRIAANVLDTYLGAAAGERVLRGSIKRGAGESIRAIIWASDLRGFTDLADRLDGPDMIALLNGYFECLAGAVLGHDGEVLKFIGDGLLAVFPYSAFADERAAAVAALAAAQGALQAIERLNEDPQAFANIPGWRPLRTGIALHEGEVFFGNVGAPERLDFTVIGRAVNAASRVEALSKSVGRSIVVTEPVKRLLDCPLEPLGERELRGLAAPISIYGVP
ncbi:adenylate/guanylate cyclase domain-containing protein [Reyranella sp.]|uniref:adenylate/guanylate cyclase domain-containing protein n=1 Tax=Reyranella sp. TaxID=1929291 RepID=UPI003F70BD7D